MVFRLQSIALTAALFGYADATGCYPAYVSGASYNSGDMVSKTKVTDTETTASCTVGTTGCPASGFKTTTTTTSTTNNYTCKDAVSAWCSQAAYTPDEQYSASAWTKESAECTGPAGTATAASNSAPTPAAWSGGGCPNAYASGSDYDELDIVSVTQNSYTMVYQCKSGTSSGWCPLTGYSPGVDAAWADAWTALGSCSGTIAPSTSPVFVSIPDAGGCPGEYSAGTAYDENDKISKDGFVYQCKGWPVSAHCSQAGYEPGTGVAWSDAWAVVGFCEGTIAPTSSPSFVSLTNMGGCPDEWVAKVAPTAYEEGDKVASMGLVYACKAWPYSGHCGQAGYEPNVDPASPGAWKDAWTLIGYCDGSIGPTGSPSFDPANSVGVCPDEWVRGSNTAYEEGDMVSELVSTIPMRKVAFKCKAWPYSGNCGQLSPLVFGGDQGWTLAGSCIGSIGPTASPSFDSLSIIATGCPAEYSSSTTDYEAGDQVSWTVSTSPLRKIVYKCREWPNVGYCNQSGFAPGSEHTDMAWTLVGACDGTMAPTGAPTAYAGTCVYTKCTTTETDVSCVPDSSGCTTCTGTAPNRTCTKKADVETCNAATVVNKWTSGTSYVEGDVVRIGVTRFKCRGWPNYLWCRQAAYQPTMQTGIWDDAWTADGMCT